MSITSETTGGSMVGSGMDVHVTGRRVVATIIDWFVIGLAGYFSGAAFSTITTDHTALPALSAGGELLALALIAAYYVLLEGYLGRTLGKMVVRVKVVSEATGKPPGLTAATVRTVLRLVDGIFFYLVAFIVVLASPKKQRLGDMAARTLVVRG